MISHLLAFVLIVALPVWDRFETRRLKTSRDRRARIQSYQMTIAWLWICAALGVAALGWRALCTIRVGSADAPWLPSGGNMVSFGVVLGGAFLIGAIFPAILARRSPPIRERFQKQFANLSFFLPRTSEERIWFAIVSASAGVCEEILFRGFLIHYFQVAPFHLPLAAAFLLSCATFGAAHLYQGIGGAIQTAFLGLVFGVLFLATGTLLLPMVLHAAVDLKLLIILPKDAKPVPAGSGFSA
jgi:uncharacterized protein